MYEVAPMDRWYSQADLWAMRVGELVVVGITDFAQQELGEIVYIELPPKGSQVVAGEAFGDIESTKTASPLVSPVSGETARRNDLLDEEPWTVNASPYIDGWMLHVLTENQSELSGLMTASEYRAARGLE